VSYVFNFIVKQTKIPYRINSPSGDMNNTKSLKVINFQAIDKRTLETQDLKKASSKIKVKLPNLDKLRPRKPRFEKYAQNQILESVESMSRLDKPTIPMFKNQYSIGQKHIEYRKQGKMSYANKIYSPSGKSYHRLILK
jgi:hypothetical protein